MKLDRRCFAIWSPFGSVWCNVLLGATNAELTPVPTNNRLVWSLTFYRYADHDFERFVYGGTLEVSRLIHVKPRGYYWSTTLNTRLSSESRCRHGVEENGPICDVAACEECGVSYVFLFADKRCCIRVLQHGKA